MTWLIVATKVAHIVALMLWCAGLILLPLALSLHRPKSDQVSFNRVRLLTHAAYTRIMTPVAVVAIGTGIMLIFLRDVFAHWFVLKILLVALLVALHGWIGHQVAQIAERREAYVSPRPALLTMANLALMNAILVLVLLKPDIPDALIPAWLTMPYGRSLWFDDPS
jgi:protoporphyrinogen IX oxidase